MSWATHISVIASDTHTQKINIADRSAASCFNLNKLLKLASIASLLFISEMAERLECPDFDPEQDAYQKITLNPQQLGMLITDIDRLFEWCSNNIAEASKAFRSDGYDEEDIIKGIAGAAEYATYHYDREASGDPEFVFCMLKSIQTVFQYGEENNIPMIYENLMEC